MTVLGDRGGFEPAIERQWRTEAFEALDQVPHLFAALREHKPATLNDLRTLLVIHGAADETANIRRSHEQNAAAWNQLEAENEPPL
ncbi:hypothetical protein ACQEVF_56645 [Nonomuraea polychroma]|uniref:hypothetical protein n=1 Tax=Nonomuraea polychroma TaxID=46176 RepID=UPI003D8CCE84